ncbi:MAG: hypothetical protein JWM87_716 [Candidatus Eremiobacteraeota bacterium]|nr:hypothetical protein [Candidatus Eremiobacteraeota bacterium]
MTKTEPAHFASRIGPGAVHVDGRRIEYALAPCNLTTPRLHILDLFPCGDERARLTFSLQGVTDDATPDQLYDFVAPHIYRRAAAFIRGCDENDVALPHRYASFPFGMTEDEIAASNAELRAIIGRMGVSAESAAFDAKVSRLEDHRRRRAS